MLCEVILWDDTSLVTAVDVVKSVAEIRGVDSFHRGTRAVCDGELVCLDYVKGTSTTNRLEAFAGFEDEFIEELRACLLVGFVRIGKDYVWDTSAGISAVQKTGYIMQPPLMVSSIVIFDHVDCRVQGGKRKVFVLEGR